MTVMRMMDWPAWLRGVAAFSAMPPGRTQTVLDWMLAEKILTEDEGLLGLGQKGEKEFGRKNFLELFSVFTSPPLFVVRHGRQELIRVRVDGTIKAHRRCLLKLILMRNPPNPMPGQVLGRVRPSRPAS